MTTKRRSEIPSTLPAIIPPTRTATSPPTEKPGDPTCSLNLKCYRPGSQGCIQRQIRVSRVAPAADHRLSKVSPDPELPVNDKQFFRRLRLEYDHNMCGFWRRYLSLKTLRQIRLLLVCSPMYCLSHYLTDRRKVYRNGSAGYLRDG
jgi:hypothetical protein